VDRSDSLILATPAERREAFWEGELYQLRRSLDVGFSNMHQLMGLVPPEQIALSLGRPLCVRWVAQSDVLGVARARASPTSIGRS
jgi:hypothetical protein